MKNTEIRDLLARVASETTLSLDEQKLILDSLLRANQRLIEYRKTFGEMPKPKTADILSFPPAHGSPERRA